MNPANVGTDLVGCGVDFIEVNFMFKLISVDRMRSFSDLCLCSNDATEML